jgi:hypothetical protein
MHDLGQYMSANTRKVTALTNISKIKESNVRLQRPFPVQYRFPILNRPSVIAGANIGMVKTEHSVIDDDDPLASSPRRTFALFCDHSLCSHGFAPTSNPAF